MKTSLYLILFLFICLSSTNCIINTLSGLSKYYHDPGSKIDITVGKINSPKTLFPFTYTYLPVCRTKDLVPQPEILGELLTGEVSYITHYEAKMKENKYCQVLCESTLSQFDADLYAWMVEHDYRGEWFIDNLPAGKNFTSKHIPMVLYESGIDLGDSLGEGKNDFYLYNHFVFNIKINESKDRQTNKPKYTVVGFNIVPYSINHTYVNETHKEPACSETGDKDILEKAAESIQKIKVNETILYTYDVVFIPSNHTLATRWDHYVNMHSDKIHWFSLINSFLVVAIFSALVVHIFCRALKRDIDYINSRAFSDDFIDDSGWKQVSNDVFRKPRKAMLLSTLIGTGAQIFYMAVISLMLTCIFYISPEYRGSIITLVILLFVFMGGVAGYISARFYKMFNETKWLKNALLTAFLYPSFAFLVFLVISFFLSLEHSSAAVSFGNLFTLLILWLCCSSPLVIIGSFIGMKKKPIKNPCKVHAVPSSIPPQPWYLDSYIICLVAGVLPFGAIFIELIYLMGSVWRHLIYILFPFLLGVIVIMIITSSIISILITYFQLCKGDYRWWWKSFFISGSVGFYVFVYSVYYYLTQLLLTRLSSIIMYFGYMFFASITVFIMSGSIGFLMTFYFLRKIYSMIKID